EIALVRAWIEAGAKGLPPGETLPRVVAVPKIAPKVAPRKAIQSIADEPKSKLLALARLGDVELRSAETRAVVRTLTGHAGPVNAVAFSADGRTLVAAGGEPGVSGEVKFWNVADGKPGRTFRGHADAIYSLALAPDGRTFATGSYDHEILLWDQEKDQPIRSFHGQRGGDGPRVPRRRQDPRERERRPDGEAVGRRHRRAARHAGRAHEGAEHRRLQPRRQARRRGRRR